MHARTHMQWTNKLGPYGSCTPGCHFRDYGPAQNKLLKPDQVLAGALTVAPVLVVWAPEVPPGPTISGFIHPSFIQAAGCTGVV